MTSKSFSDNILAFLIFLSRHFARWSALFSFGELNLDNYQLFFWRKCGIHTGWSQAFVKCRMWVVPRSNNFELCSLTKLNIALGFYDAFSRRKKTKSTWQQTRECGFVKLLCNCPPKLGEYFERNRPALLLVRVLQQLNWTGLASHAVLDSNTFYRLIKI